MFISTDIWIDGVKLPPADMGGIHVTPQTIWSQNAGRNSTTAKFSGDIKAVKYDITYSKSYATQEEFELIDSLVNNLVGIHSVRLCIRPSQGYVTKNFYIGSGTFSYTISRCKNGKTHYENLSFEMIEQ
ncbi:MAG: hypothetical protein Q4D35_03025 [Ruminococcus sp.]|nr:hypothetical protein [Ruminococcus sp.]